MKWISVFITGGGSQNPKNWSIFPQCKVKFWTSHRKSAVNPRGSVALTDDLLRIDLCYVRIYIYICEYFGDYLIPRYIINHHCAVTNMVVVHKSMGWIVSEIFFQICHDLRCWFWPPWSLISSRVTRISMHLAMGSMRSKGCVQGGFPSFSEMICAPVSSTIHSGNAQGRFSELEVEHGTQDGVSWNRGTPIHHL